MDPERWRRIEQIYDSAVTRPESQWVAFLEQVCAGDEALRREVESLLAREASAEHFLEGPALGVTAQALAKRRSQSMIGRTLGPYQIVSLVGMGGMGEVYAAHDSRLNRQVAVKILPPHLAGHPEALKRFEREAKAVAALSHPNVLSIFDYGTEQGVCYAVMELLEGESLRARLRASLPGWRQVLEIATQIAEGLAAAHAKGVVHRDLKPENVFLTSGGPVKILDFGLARVSPPSQADAEDPTSSFTTLTVPGQIMGTAAYMSPEQVRGEEAGPPSDIFSFGCMLHEMLTGQQLFRRKTDAQTVAAILMEEPPLTLPDRETPPDCGAVLWRCLEKDPERRFPSGRELAAALRTLTAWSALPLPGRRGYLSRRTVGVWGAGLLTTLLASVFGWRNWPHGRFSYGAVEASLAVLPFENLSGDPGQEYFADGMTEALIADLGKIGSLRVISRTSVTRFKKARQSLPEIARQLGVNHVIEGSVARAGNRVRIRLQLLAVPSERHIWAESYERDERDVFTLQGELARAAAGEIRVRLGPMDRERLGSRRAIDPAAYDAYLRGRHQFHQRGRDTLPKAAQFFQQAIDLEPAWAPAYAGLADTYLVMASNGWYAPGQYRPQARAAAKRALELDGDLAEAYATMGGISDLDWNWREAECMLRLAIERLPSYATAHQWYGDLLAEWGRFPEALVESRKSLELDPLSPAINSSLGVVFYLARRYSEAERQFSQTLDLFPKHLPTLIHLGMTYLAEGKYDKAKAVLNKAASYSGRAGPVIGLLGNAYGCSGDRATAEKLLAELQDSPSASPVVFASIYMSLGDRDRAISWLEKGLEQRSPFMGELKVGAIFDSLRSDPRFQAIVRKMNWPD